MHFMNIIDIFILGKLMQPFEKAWKNWGLIQKINNFQQQSWSPRPFLILHKFLSTHLPI